jgi:predicted outer membrane repeat protein
VRRYSLFLALLFTALTLFTPQNPSFATTVNVNSVTELNSAILNATPNTIITLTSDIEVLEPTPLNPPNSANGFANITKKIIINGNGHRIYRSPSATAEFRFFEVTSSGNLTLINTTLDGGYVYNGGAIFNQLSGVLTILNSRFLNNTASNGSSGGAIYSNGQLTVRNSTFSNNTATVNNVTSGGGAIIYRDWGTSLIIESSTFNNNHTDGSGGAVYNYQGQLRITNSTFVENSSRNGGAIYGGHITNNSTFINNNALIYGTTFYQSQRKAEVNNSILVAPATPLMCEYHSNIQPSDIFSGSNNITNNASTCGNLEFVSTSLDPSLHLAPLANNGGPTQTVALTNLATNPAVNSAGANALAYDQRGAAVQGGTRDIGAFEYSAGAITYPLISSGVSTVTEGQPTPITIHISNGQNFSGKSHVLIYDSG